MGLTPLSHRVPRARELCRQAVQQPRSTEDILRDQREEADAETGGIEDEREDSASSPSRATGSAW